MHHGLISKSVLVRITLKVKHEHLDHITFGSGGGQVDRLTPHVAVPMLSHLQLGSLILSESIPHELKHSVCSLQAHELKNVHVVLEAHAKILLPLQI